MKKITQLSFIIALFSLSILSAQNSRTAQQNVPEHRTCGMEQHMKKLLQDPKFAKEFAERQAAFNVKYEEIKAQKANGTYQKKATLYIPVAVHFPTGSEANRACLEAHAQTQIDVINQDYTATNPDQGTNWPGASSFYPGVTPGSVDVKFCIATKNHPTVSPAITDGNLAVTIGSQSGTYGSSDVNTTWAGYMNFVIKDAGSGILGYSPLAGSISGGQCVVMNFGSYGTGAGCTGFVPTAPYNLGRTVTHELGHFYNLDHTFNGGCTAPGDSVADTPAVANATYGTPAPGSVNGCVSGEKALTMNYMDYVNDTHMYMFSAGQATRMEAYFATVASDWKQNVVTCQSPDYTVTATNSPVTVCAPADGVFNFNFATSNGYNTNTTFSVTAGLPTNATATFSPTSMNTDGNFTLTIGNIAAITPGNYPMTITATGATTKTVDVTLSVQSAAPSVPSLTSPANNATNQPLSVNLIWGAATNAATYTVQTATDSGFTANLTTNSVNTTTYNATGLTQNTQYFWRVKAVNGCGESNYSSVFNFTTASIQCNTPSDNTSVNIPNATADGTEAAPGVSTITVTNANNVNITDINVTVNITYPYLTDLRVELEHPDGTKVNLADHLTDNGGPGAGSNYTNTIFDDASASALTTGTAPFTGTFKPDSPLNVLNGKESAGDWKLNVYDNWTADTGTINSWSIEICGSQVLSTGDNDYIKGLTIYPNPSNGIINISFNNDNPEKTEITLFDMRGRRIFNQTFNNSNPLFNKSLNLSHLESAIYILKIKKGAIEVNKRILIK